MSKQIAKNTFTGGLQMDLHPLSSQNTILTNALNATLVTIDGDEMILQNDLGNLKIRDQKTGEEDYVQLTPGFIPVGMKSHNGIAYIASYNPTTGQGEIGTFPSPNYPLHTLSGSGSDDNPFTPDPSYPIANRVKLSDDSNISWATWDIGATSEDSLGGYYGWGDPTGEESSRDQSKYGGGQNINISGTEYDIATAKWGRDWRLPTKEEFEELYTYTWEDQGTRFKITGTNGNYIYLNKGGYKNPYRVDGIQNPNDSFYWIGDISDIMSSIAPYNYPYMSQAFSSNQLKEITTGAYRMYQFFIRPVYIGTESDTPEDPSESSNNEITVLSRDISSSDIEYNQYKDLINSYQPLYNLYRGSVKVKKKWYTLDSKQDQPIEYILHPLRSVFFGFDLEHPVDIEIQPSYDGSVNLILNDGLNIPRLINSRFSVLENGTWEIPKRRRNNDNIYRVNYKTVVKEGEIRDSYLAESVGGELSYEAEIRITKDEGCEIVSVLLTKENYEAAKSIFDITTSLNKRISIFPIIKFNGVIGSGNLPVGNYTLYFKYCDEDGNETDFIGQSSIISIFKGKDNDPFSIDGGVRDMDSNKSIDITLNHIDSAYNFVKVYYTRTSADADENRAAVAYKVTKTYPIYNDDDDNTKSYCHIVLNGDEEKETITIEELNERYYIVNSAETQAQSNNMLFLGNVNTADLHYKDLTDLSLRIIPYVTRTISKNKIGLVSQSNYKDFTNLEKTSDHEKKHLWSGEYYNTKNIYYNTGYWNEEFYRLGIVYIYEDNSLSPVFNILGYCTKGLQKEDGKFYYGVIESPKNRENKADNSCDYDISKDHITEIFHAKQQEEETARNVNVAFTKIPPIYDENKKRYYIDLEPADPYSFSSRGRGDFECTNYINQNTLNAGGVIQILDDEKTDTFPYKIEDPEDESQKRLHEDSFNRNYADFYYRADNKDPKKLAEQYIYNLGVYINQDIICYLKNELKIKGFFIVRQKRIPTILAQAYTMPWDKEAKVPIVEYWDFRWDTKIDNLPLAKWESDTQVSKEVVFPNYIGSTNTSGKSTDYFSLSRKGKYFFPQYKRRYFVESFMLQASEDAFQLYDIVENEQDYNQNERKRSIEHKYRPRLFDIDRSTIDYPMFWTSKLAEDNPLNIPDVKVEFSISLNKNITSGIMEGDKNDYGSCETCKTDDCKTSANYRPYNSNFNDALFYYIQYKEEKEYSGASVVPPMVYPNTNFSSGFSEKPYACTGTMQANGPEVYYRLSDSNNKTIKEELLNGFSLEGFGTQTDLEECHVETYYYAGERLPEKYKNYVYQISNEESGEYELIDDGWYSSPKSAINAYLTQRKPSDLNKYYSVWVAIAFLGPNEKMINGEPQDEDGKTYNVVPTQEIISNLNVKGDEGEDNSLYSYESLTSISDYEAGYVVEGSEPSKPSKRRYDDNFATYYQGNFTENTDGCIVTAKNLVNSITDGRSGTRGRMYRWIRSYYVNRMLDDTDDLNHMAKDKNSLASASGATLRHFYDLYKYCNGNQFTAICPEFEIKQSLYNQLFTGASYKIKYTPYQQGIFLRNFNNERLYYTGYPSMLNNGSSWYTAKIGEIEWNLDDKGGVHYNYLEYPKRTTVEQKSELDWGKGKGRECKIVAVTDSVPVVAIDNYIYRAVCGDAAEAYRFEYITEEHCPKRMFKEVESGAFDDDELWANLENIHDFNMVRGLFSPYLGMSLVKTDDDDFPNSETERNRQYGQTINIYNELAENEYGDNLKLRFRDTSPFYTVSERISFDNLKENIGERDSVSSMMIYKPNPIYESDLVYVKKRNEEDFDPGVYLDIFRGDCYLCTFTHRLNRNFQDPSAPSNDKIVDPKTWMRNYNPDKGTEQLEKINRGDVNAVKLGSWLTIKVRASYNLSIRSLDERYTTESATMGRARGFYPLQQASAEGGYKIPESAVLNDGFGSTVGERWYNILPNAPYYNSNFNYRILYSDVNVQDSYKNGYRTFRYGNMQDYTKQYGQIIKLVEWYGDLICVFEHGVALLPVNERALAATGSGGEVFINNSNVLPDALNAIISDKFGSQWADSVIKTPYYVYGVDASTKKIWRTNGKTLQILSDMKVEKFLKENIPLAENDSTPYIGIKNVKTHYNQTKSDVMFTFYTRNPNNEEDEIAWNLCLNEIGGNSEGESGHFVTFYSWIPLFSATINNRWYSFDREAFRGQILSKNKCCRADSYWTYAKGQESENCCPRPTDLYILDAENKKKEKGIYQQLIPPFLWEHNNAQRRPLPTHWYGRQHPFEFEFIVLEDGSIHKIFENLQIISNKAEPESFHYEVTGDVYEFHEDKPNIFFRQEFQKNVYANMGSHWTYDPEAYSRVHPNQKAKSTIFPLYYMRKDEYDQIYDNYQKMTSDHWDYQNLSGTEVFWNKRDHEFDLCTHIKNLPITGHWERCSKEEWERIYNQYKGCDDLILRSKLKKEVKPVEAFTFDTLAFIGGECKKIVKTDIPSNIWYYKWVEGGRLRGNTHYKEDKWDVQIPSITFMQRNEPEWPKATEVVREKGEDYKIEYQKTMGRYHNPNIANTEEISVPPMVLDLAHIPNDLNATVINWETLPNTFSQGQQRLNVLYDGSLSNYISPSLKWTNRKETKIRDKYCKIKVRYSGEELAIISAILTTFNTSIA